MTTSMTRDLVSQTKSDIQLIGGGTIWVKETPKHNTFKHESNSSPARRKCAV
jgi:hypothetical protein